MSCADLIGKLTALRHELHQYPEVSGEERETAARVCRELEGCAPDEIHRNLGGHGVAAVYQSAYPGPTVMFRCELDALPITELSDVPYRSKVPGKGHLCGHDGHMVILLGLAHQLGKQRPRRGRVVLLFQPAEEDGSGAKAVIEDPAFAALRPDYSFALHNFPGLPLGYAALRGGPFSCASRGVRVAFEGKTAHAAQPETGRSPIPALAALACRLPALAEEISLENKALAMATVTHMSAGAASFGISPGGGEIWITLRTLLDGHMQRLMEGCEKEVSELARTHGLSAQITVHDDFAHCENGPKSTALFAQALQALEIPHGPLGLPLRASEDFGRFGALSDSTMILIGAGEQHPSLHNPDYDFPDALILKGINIFKQLLQTLDIA